MWQAATAGDPPTVVSGTCVSGYYVVSGAPYRGCDVNGTYTDVQNSCQRTGPVFLCVCVCVYTHTHTRPS